MTELVRVQKFLADCGICSRRAAEKLIEEGRVTIGPRVAVLGDKVAVDEIGEFFKHHFGVELDSFTMTID